MSTEFLLTSLLVVVIPGTGTIYTVLTGLLYGVLASGFRRRVQRSPGAILWLRRTFAITFVALSISLAVTVIR